MLLTAFLHFFRTFQYPSETEVIFNFTVEGILSSNQPMNPSKRVSSSPSNSPLGIVTQVCPTFSPLAYIAIPTVTFLECSDSSLARTIAPRKPAGACNTGTVSFGRYTLGLAFLVCLPLSQNQQSVS